MTTKKQPYIVKCATRILTYLSNYRINKYLHQLDNSRYYNILDDFSEDDIDAAVTVINRIIDKFPQD